MKKITEETQIKHQVKDYLKLWGFFVFPILQGLGAYKGIPDMCAVGYGLTLFIEVKAGKGKQSKYQKQFENNVFGHGGHYILVKKCEDIKNYLYDYDLNKNKLTGNPIIR
jgi:hypothetical protein